MSRSVDVLAILLAFGLGGCGQGTPATATATDGAAPPCLADGALAGTAYSVSKSRFSFGGTPVKMVASSVLTRWTGPDGAVAIFSNGSELASLDANAPEDQLPPLHATVAKLSSWATQYWEAMGVRGCEIGASQPVGYEEVGSGGPDGGEKVVAGSVTVGLERAYEGIHVVESVATVVFDSDYRTTNEAFYWPTIPADVVSAAVSLQAKLSTSSGLEAYKAKLPSDAQGDGQVAIHHTSASGTDLPGGEPFRAVATYDVTTSDGAPDRNSLLSFDSNGDAVTLPP